MMKRWEIINHLIHKNGYKSYLEIGVQSMDQNYNKIECGDKTGVDPNPTALADYVLTSDEFFERNKRTFDIIFIDGLHEAAQAYKDIINSQKILNDGGTIVLHDCNPTSEAMQLVPRKTSQWTGDTWKAFYHYRNWIDLSCFVVDTDWGIGIIPENKAVIRSIFIGPPVGSLAQATEKAFKILSYNNLEANRQEWLNLKTVQEFLNS